MDETTVKGFKEPSYQDRTAAAARAKSSALDQLKATSKRDEALIAARVERQRQRGDAAAAKRAAVQEAKTENESVQRENAIQHEADRARAHAAPPTEAERKAARDARYAARKARRS